MNRVVIFYVAVTLPGDDISVDVMSVVNVVVFSTVVFPEWKQMSWYKYDWVCSDNDVVMLSMNRVVIFSIT